MENTMSGLFPNDTSEWFVAVQGVTQGPMFAHEVFSKLQKKELAWVDFVYRAKEGQWVRISDHSEFSKLLPKAPENPKPAAAVVPPPPPAEEAKEWFVYKDQSQSGPYSYTELKVMAGAVDPEQTFVWKSGMSGWVLIKEMKDLSPIQPPISPVGRISQNQNKEKREAPRKPLVARVYMTNQSDLVIGICRDVSIGGMQVLSEKVPGNPGTVIKIHVDPHAESKIKGFTAQGMIVRILEDQRGFSFRFIKLQDSDRDQIQQYVQGND